MPRTARSYFLLAVMLALVGCGAVRNQATTLGSDVVGAVRETQPELFEIERTLADSMAGFLGRAIEDKVLSRASGLWDSMLIKLNEQSRVVVGQLAQGVERDLNRSLQVTLSENLDITGDKSAVLVDTLFYEIRQNIGPLMDTLRPQLLGLISEVTALVSNRVMVLDSTLARSETGKGLTRTLKFVVVVLAITVIGGGLAWRRTEKRNRRAFQAALQATPPFQRDAVQQVLRTQGFDRQAEWLK